MKFHHIGYAVFDIETTAEGYLNAGWKMSEPVVDSIQNSRIAFLSKEGEPLIELVAPVDDKSPVNKTLEKSGVGPYHICYQVSAIEAAVAELRKKQFVLLFRPVGAPAINNCKICYMYSKSEGLIELVEI